ncbi:MAG: ATPase [Legionellales bacterium]|nr:ATPase [Legionellales bacterium]
MRTPLQRLLNLPNLLKKKSFFLFGPRATGKSTLIKQQFPKTTNLINLLDNELYFRLKTAPSELESIIMAHDYHDIVIIDEIQRIPELLNDVHRLIEDAGIKFLLTGSSARKLKHNQSNLLAGRARQAELFPLTYSEIPDFNLEHYLRFGGIPMIYLSDDPTDDLHAYVNTYLKEEIQAEALVREIPAFSRFLHFSALTSGELLNFSSLSNDVAISANTAREYYHILEDTFIGFMLPAWTKSTKRKAISTAKFYYFDIGVKNTLANIKSIDPNSDLYGKAFEHLIACELRAYISYRRKHAALRYWQAKSGYEVDFIIEDDIAIEIKSTKRVHDKHLKGLKALAEEQIVKQYYLVSHDKINRKVDGKYIIIYWKDFLKKLWDDAIY